MPRRRQKNGPNHRLEFSLWLHPKSKTNQKKHKTATPSATAPATEPTKTADHNQSIHSVINLFAFGSRLHSSFDWIFDYKKNKKMKKWKTSFGPVNYDVSWRSPCRKTKKQEKSNNNTSEKTLFFLVKQKNEDKSMKKLVAVGNTSKIDKVTALRLPF